MKSQTYTLTNTQTTAIVIGHGLLEKIASIIPLHDYSNIVIIADTTTEKLFVSTLKKGLQGVTCPVHTITLEEGEQSKQFSVLETIVKQLHDFHLDRKSCIIALGGGVVGDISTLAAGLYYRGIDCIQIPTTLLSQVDSAYGGKGAIDLGMHKNTIGVIKHPRFVISDIETLHSLPKDQFTSGMGEVIKYAIAMDKTLFALLEQDSKHDIEEVITRCVTLKMSLVEKDPEDMTGVRAMLNFGHTLGQAIELQTTMLHGQAIAIGMAFVIKLSEQEHMLSSQDAQKALALLQKYNLPITVTGINPQDTIEQMKKDKKAIADSIRFVLVSKIGEAKTNCIIEETLIKKALSHVLL